MAHGQLPVVNKTLHSGAPCVALGSPLLLPLWGLAPRSGSDSGSSDDPFCLRTVSQSLWVPALGDTPLAATAGLKWPAWHLI